MSSTRGLMDNYSGYSMPDYVCFDTIDILADRNGGNHLFEYLLLIFRGAL